MKMTELSDLTETEQELEGVKEHFDPIIKRSRRNLLYVKIGLAICTVVACGLVVYGTRSYEKECTQLNNGCPETHQKALKHIQECEKGSLFDCIATNLYSSCKEQK